MQKISFKNNLIKIYEDRYEFEHIRKSLFYRDLLINGVLYLGITFILMFLLFAEFSLLSQIPINYLRAVLIPILGAMWFPLLVYYNLHKSVIIAKSDIEKIWLNRNQKKLIIEYKHKYKNEVAVIKKHIELPRNKQQRQSIISQIKDAKLLDIEQ